MAKTRNYQKKRSRLILTISIIALLIIAVFGLLFVFKEEKPIDFNSLIKFEATGSIPSPDNYLAYNTAILNPKKGLFEFAFVSVKSKDVVQYTKTFDHPNIIPSQAYVNHALSGYQTDKCGIGKLIRYFRCSSPTDRNTCVTDLFDEAWQVQKHNYDHPAKKDWYLFDQTFYFTYSCYEPGQIFPDNFERSWLLNNKCVGFIDSGGQGTNYNTEKFCLDALAKINNPDYKNPDLLDPAIVQYKKDCEKLGGTFNEQYIKCDFDNSLKIARTNCLNQGGTWDSFKNVCIKPKITTDTAQVACTKNGGTWSSQENRCIVSNPTEFCKNAGLVFDSATAKCVSPSSEPAPTSTTGTTIEELYDSFDVSTFSSISNETTTPGMEVTTTPEIPTCKGYEKLNEEGECKFSLTKAFTGGGLSDIWEDYPYWVIAIAFILLGGLYYWYTSPIQKVRK